MSRLDKSRVFDCLVYIHRLDVGSPEFQVGRALVLMKERMWLRFLDRVVSWFPAGSPEHDIAVALLRILSGESERAA